MLSKFEKRVATPLKT